MVTDIPQRLMCPSGQANCWNYLEVADPDPWMPAQRDYLTQYLQSFVNALHSATPADATTGYPAFIDTASFVNQVIVQELTRNLDAYSRSQYLHKDRDAKIFAGPLWDYDLTAGVGIGSGTTGATCPPPAGNTRRRPADSRDGRLVSASDGRSRLQEPAGGAVEGPAAGAAVGRRDPRAHHAPHRPAGRRRRTQLPEVAHPDDRTGRHVHDADRRDLAGQVTAMQDWLIARAAWLDTMWR